MTTLPTVTIDGVEVSFRRLPHNLWPGTSCRQLQGMSESDLAALLAALPDEMLARAIASLPDERKGGAAEALGVSGGLIENTTKRALEMLAEQRDHERAARQRAERELASIKAGALAEQTGKGREDGQIILVRRPDNGQLQFMPRESFRALCEEQSASPKGERGSEEGPVKP